MVDIEFPGVCFSWQYRRARGLGLFLIDKSSTDKLSASVPTLDRYYRAVLEEEFNAARARISDFMSASAEERYQHFQGKFPDLLQRVPLQQIASYLGITPQSLSRIRKDITERK
jgi:CRP-like cAMP-binding protein